VGRHRVRVTRWVQIPVRAWVWVSFCTRKRVRVWVWVKFYLVGMGVVGQYPISLYPLPSLLPTHGAGAVGVRKSFLRPDGDNAGLIFHPRAGTCLPALALATLPPSIASQWEEQRPTRGVGLDFMTADVLLHLCTLLLPLLSASNKGGRPRYGGRRRHA
jgi:hypothetical protein